MLEGWLDFQRATLALKCAGLDDDQVRRASVTPSSLTLLGLVRHMAEVERNWFQRVFTGTQVPLLFGEGGAYGFGPDDGLGIDDALEAWRAEVARGRELITGASLDAPGKLSPEDAAVAGEETVSLRWILVHMIEEYARHNGHADLIRESIDGVTGA